MTSDDALYRLHQFQASRRGLAPCSYPEFVMQMVFQSETDLSQLFLPEPEVPSCCRPVVKVGTVYATDSAMARLVWYVMLEAVAVHEAGNWGQVSPEQWLANDRAVASGGRICSAHHSYFDGQTFWVISEGNPRWATIVMPEDTSFLTGGT